MYLCNKATVPEKVSYIQFYHIHVQCLESMKVFSRKKDREISCFTFCNLRYYLLNLKLHVPVWLLIVSLFLFDIDHIDYKLLHVTSTVCISEVSRISPFLVLILC